MKKLVGSMVLVLVLVLGLGSVQACDVNLVTIMSGEDPNDAFAALVQRLASEVRSVGQNLSRPEVAGTNLQVLMKTWVEFDQKFQVTPPEWAKSDPDWSAKIKQMSSRIGSIQILITENKDAHDQIVDLNKNLIGLFDAMPMSQAKRQLAKIFHGVSLMTETMKGENLTMLRENLTKTRADLKMFQEQLSPDMMPLTNDFAGRLQQLEGMTGPSVATFSFEIRAGLGVTDEAFQLMNAKLRSLLK
jgi:hypothetical protein